MTRYISKLFLLPLFVYLFLSSFTPAAAGDLYNGTQLSHQILINMEAFGVDESGTPLYTTYREYYDSVTNPLKALEETFGIWSYEEKDGQLYMGIGAHPNGGGSRGILSRFNPSTNQVETLGPIEEEGFFGMEFINDNELLIVDTDPVNGPWDAGNLNRWSETNGITIDRYQQPDGIVVAVTETDENGVYAFENLDPVESYYVKFITPDGYRFTSRPGNPSDGSRKGQRSIGLSDPIGRTGIVSVCGPYYDSFRPYTNMRIEAGLVEGSRYIQSSGESVGFHNSNWYLENGSTIGGKVWKETNDDGIYDVDEAMFPGVKVEIWTKDPYFPCSLHAMAIEQNEQTGIIYKLNTTYAFESQVYKSEDGGDNWELAGLVNRDRGYDLISFNNALYMSNTNNHYSSYISKSVDGGKTWTDIENGTSTWYPRMITFDNNKKLLSLINPNHEGFDRKIAEINKSDQVLIHDLPDFTLNHESTYPIIEVDGRVYAVTKEGYIVRTTCDRSLENWEIVVETGSVDLHNLYHWKEMNYLVFSERTSEGKAWYLDLNEYGSIKGVAYNDVSGNGSRDPNDNGIYGIEVQLINNSGEVVCSETSGYGGYYTFSGIIPGSYSMKFVESEGLFIVNGETDPGSIEEPGLIDPIVVAAGEIKENVDLGYVQSSTLSGTAWIDKNLNGKRDTSEDLAPGIRIDLVSSFSTDENVTVSTNQIGEYQISGIRPGEYVLSINTNDHVLTRSNRGKDDALDSDFNRKSGRLEIQINPGEVLINDVGLLHNENGEYGVIKGKVEGIDMCYQHKINLENKIARRDLPVVWLFMDKNRDGNYDRKTELVSTSKIGLTGSYRFYNIPLTEEKSDYMIHMRKKEITEYFNGYCIVKGGQKKYAELDLIDYYVINVRHKAYLDESIEIEGN